MICGSIEALYSSRIEQPPEIANLCALLADQSANNSQLVTHDELAWEQHVFLAQATGVSISCLSHIYWYCRFRDRRRHRWSRGSAAAMMSRIREKTTEDPAHPPGRVKQWKLGKFWFPAYEGLPSLNTSKTRCSEP